MASNLVFSWPKHPLFFHGILGADGMMVYVNLCLKEATFEGRKYCSELGKMTRHFTSTNFLEPIISSWWFQPN